MAKKTKKQVKSKNDKPILQFSILCDGIAKGPGEKPVFVGIFSNIIRPSIVPQFFIVNRWINGAGEFTEVVKILDPDLKKVTQTTPAKFSLPNKIHSHDIYNGFSNFNFKVSGTYWIVVELDGELVQSYPLAVFKG